MLSLQMIVQLILPSKASIAITVAVTNRTVERFRASLMFLHMALQVRDATRRYIAAWMRAAMIVSGGMCNRSVWRCGVESSSVALGRDGVAGIEQCTMALSR